MGGEAFKALADPTRRRILELLRSADLTAGELADHFDMTKPSISPTLTPSRPPGWSTRNAWGNPLSTASTPLFCKTL